MASKAWLKLRSLTSEEVGGLVSYLGTIGVSLSKDRDSFLATAICLAGESMFLVKRGRFRSSVENLKRGHGKAFLKGEWPEGLAHKPDDDKVLAGNAAGYALSYGFFIATNLAIEMSKTTAGNRPLQAVVFAMTASWGLALARPFVEKQAQKLAATDPERSARLQRFADNIPTVISSTSFAMRIPTLALAYHGGNHVMFGCTALWGAAELFMGRVPSRVASGVSHGVSALRERASHFIWAEGPAESRSQQAVKRALRGTFLREPPPPLPPQAIAYWR